MRREPPQSASPTEPGPESKPQSKVQESELERQGRRLGRPAWWFLALGAALAVAGILLVVLADSWALILGIILLVLAGPPLVVGVGLLLSSLVSRWAARHRSFA